MPLGHTKKTLQVLAGDLLDGLRGSGEGTQGHLW